MKKIKTILVLCTLILIGSPILANTALTGGTGLISIPSAKALSFREFNLSVDYKYHSEYDNQDQWVYQGNLGTFQNLELGFIGGSVPTEGVYLSAKYYLTAQNEQYPMSMAIGTQKLTSKTPNLYMVASKSFLSNVTLHGGFRAIFSDETIDAGIMAGTTYPLKPHVILVSDVDYENGEYEFNTGINFLISPEVKIRINMLDILDTGEDGRWYSIGLSLNRFI